MTEVSSATGLQVEPDAARLRVRRFAPGDLPALLAVERVGFGRDAYPRHLFLEYQQAGALFLVATAGTELAGYALATARGRRCELVSIAVAPAFRRRGAGGRLLRAVVRRSRAAGIERISLMVKVTNTAALAFYEGHGFRRVRRVWSYYEDGSDGLLMSCVVEA